MAGARQGWIEAPYVTLPASLDGILAGAVAVPGQSRDIRILPGLAQRRDDAPDVMRGEETQLAGILPLFVTGRHVDLHARHAFQMGRRRGRRRSPGSAHG